MSASHRQLLRAAGHSKLKLATCSTHRHLRPCHAIQGICSRTVTSSSTGPPVSGPRIGPRMPVTAQQLILEFQNVYREAKERRLQVRADGYVAVGDVINRSALLRPKTSEEAGRLMYRPRITIRQFVDAAGEDNSVSLLHEPRLHCLGDTPTRPVWWVRQKEQAPVPQHVDQATYRIMPGSKVRNAIYKATLDEWEHIRVHGLSPAPAQEMIVMASIDKIDEEDKNTSFIYVFLDMEEAMKGGVEFFFTRHLRVVSPGDKRGVIPPRFFKDAVKVVNETKTMAPQNARNLSHPS